MKNYKALNGTIFIKTRQVMNDRTESGLYKDTTYDVHGKMMIYAEVVAVSEKGSGEVMFEIDKGTPKNREDAEFREYVRNHDKKHDIQVGDRAYFHYLTLEDPMNFVAWDGNYKIFKVPVHDVFLSIRDGKTIMHNQYVTGNQYWGEGWEPVEVDGKTIAGKINEFGMVIQTKDEPLEDHAIVDQIKRGFDPYSRHKEVHQGDIVMLLPNCEFRNEIERVEKWIFTHTDILAVIEKDQIRPVGDIVRVKLKEKEYKGKVLVNKDYLEIRDEGHIISSGGLVDEDLFRSGLEIKFSKARSRVLDDGTILIRECNILGIMAYAL